MHYQTKVQIAALAMITLFCLATSGIVSLYPPPNDLGCRPPTSTVNHSTGRPLFLMVRRLGLVIGSRFIFPRNPEPVVPQQIRPSPPSESGDTQSNERACKDKAKTVQGIRHDSSIQDDNKRQPEYYNKDHHRPSGADQSNTGAANPANPARPIQIGRAHV